MSPTGPIPADAAQFDDQQEHSLDSGSKLTGAKTVLILLLLCNVVNFADRTMINTLGEAIRHDLHLSDTQLGLLGGLSFALLYSVMGIPIARFSDRSSRVRVLSIAITFWSFATMLCAAATSYIGLLVTRAFVGVGEAGCTPPAHSLLTDYFPPKRRAFAISVFYLGIPLGAFSGAMFAGMLAEYYGWRVAFAVVGAPGLLLAMVVKLMLKEPPRGRFDPAVKSGDNPSLGDVIKVLWTTPGLRAIVIGITIVAFTIYSIAQFLIPLFVRVFGMSYSQAALAFGFIAAGSAAVGTPLGGFLADKLSRRDPRWLVWLPGAGLFMASPLYIYGILQPSWSVLVFSVFCAGIASNLYHGPTFASVHNSISPQMRATATAIILFLSSAVGLAFGPLLTGMASDWYARGAFNGDYGTCLEDAATVATSVKAACAQASGAGVRYALATVSICHVLSALHYLVAGFRLKQGSA